MPDAGRGNSPRTLTEVLDAAYREWVKEGQPAGEAVVHLNEFSRAGLWHPQGSPERVEVPTCMVCRQPTDDGHAHDLAEFQGAPHGEDTPECRCVCYYRGLVKRVQAEDRAEPHV